MEMRNCSRTVETVLGGSFFCLTGNFVPMLVVMIKMSEKNEFDVKFL